MLTLGSLFAGIGGLELGLERTGGFKTVWQVEKDPHARAILAKHWPWVERYVCVEKFPPTGEFRVDVISGGFPCQDISYAGNGRGQAGIDGERSGLWQEFSRIICKLRPRYVVVENSPAITHRGLGRVLGDLAKSGYDAEWQCVPAAAVGAHHIRDRIFIIAYANDQRDWQRSAEAFFAYANNQGESGVSEYGEEWFRLPGCTGEAFALPEPDLGGMADGLPRRMDRIKRLGNAVVPQVAEWIGYRILEIEQTRNGA